MAKYYYDKYSVVAIDNYIAGTLTSIGQLTASVISYTYFSLNALTGIWSNAGSEVTKNPGDGTQTYKANGTNILTLYGSGNEIYSYPSKLGTPVNSKGTLIQSNIIAEDGTYPIDGVHTDGYWYVKKGLVFPALKININSTLKTSVDGWVNVNGALRKIDSMWTNVNGVLKKI